MTTSRQALLEASYTRAIGPDDKPLAFGQQSASTYRYWSSVVTHEAEAIVFAMGIPLQVEIHMAWDDDFHDVGSGQWSTHVLLSASCSLSCRHAPDSIWVKTAIACACEGDPLELDFTIQEISGLDEWMEALFQKYNVAGNPLANALAAPPCSFALKRFLEKAFALVKGNPNTEEWPDECVKLEEILLAASADFGLARAWEARRTL